MSTHIELLLFSKDLSLVEVADRAGMDGFIIDWEDRERFQRQQLAGEPVDTTDDLQRITSITQRPVWCRINQPGEWTEAEVEQAIEHGADLILLPMVRSPDEVKHFLSLVAGRTQTGVLVETVEACACAPQLAALPLDRVYVGLFDLLRSRGGGDLFEPLTDGTVERLFGYHLPDLTRAFQGMAAMLKPGGRMVFCEPNAWFFPFYLQILLTPRMRWSVDKGVMNMRQGVLTPALKSSNFQEITYNHYGFLPPQLYNPGWGKCLDHGIDKMPFPARTRAFQIITATQ